MSHILTTNIMVSRVNLINNDYVAGLPAPSAFLGLTACIFHDLSLNRKDARCIPILHNVWPSAGRTRPEYQRKNKVFKPVEMMETMTGTVLFSLLIDFPEPVDTHAVKKSLEQKRLAGGTIQSHDGSASTRVLECPPDGSAFRHASRGRALIPGIQADMMGITAFGEPGDFRRVRKAAYLRPTDEHPETGWRVPVAIGYRYLTTPSRDTPPPAGSRDPDIPHVFAEPGVGVAELVSVRNPLLSGRSQSALSELFWQWSSNSRMSVVHPVYLTE